MAGKNGYNETEIDGMTGFVFMNRFGNVHNPQIINRTIKRIYEAYNASEMVKAANLKVIQEIMGHANIETTMEIFVQSIKISHTKFKSIIKSASLKGNKLK